MTGILTTYSKTSNANAGGFGATQHSYSGNEYSEGEVVLYPHPLTDHLAYGYIVSKHVEGSAVTYMVRSLRFASTDTPLTSDRIIPAGVFVGAEHKPEVFTKEVIGTAVAYMRLAANLLGMGRHLESGGKNIAEGPIGEVADDYRPNILSIIEGMEETILPEYKVIACFRETVRARDEDEAKEKVRSMIASFCTEEGGSLEHQADVDVE